MTNTPQTQEFELMTTDLAAKYLATSPAYLRNNCKRLGIPTYRLGKQLRFRKAELDQWLEDQCASNS